MDVAKGMPVRVAQGSLAVLATLVSISASTAVQSETLYSTSNGRSSYEAALKVLDGRASEQYSGSDRLRPKPTGLDGRVPRFTGSYKGQYLSHAKSVARKHGIPEDLFLRLVQQESGWNPSAKSHAGAIGLAQLMPQTARALGVNPNDPKQNLEGGARYLRTQYNRFRSWKLALAAYNAGPEAVAKYNGVPPYKETQGYVKKILGNRS